MATPKIALAAPETIPLDKLEIHEDNVRKSAESKGSIEDLAADIAARGLLQSLSVRPLLDADGKETCRYGVQAGGRRYSSALRPIKPRAASSSATSFPKKTKAHLPALPSLSAWLPKSLAKRRIKSAPKAGPGWKQPKISPGTTKTASARSKSCSPL